MDPRIVCGLSSRHKGLVRIPNLLEAHAMGP